MTENELKRCREEFSEWFKQEFECEADFGLVEASMCYKAWQRQSALLAKAVEALEDIANHGVSQSAAMNMPEEQWAWRCFNNLQYEARTALAEINKGVKQ